MPTKYETIPFDAARVNEKSVKVITRDGQKVKILFTALALPNERPVFGIVSPNSKNAVSHSWYKNGQYRPDSLPHDLDLFLKVPIERKAKNHTFTVEQIRYLTIARDEVEVTLGSGIDDPEDESIYKKAVEFLNNLIDNAKTK